jgi:hypothetical protein
MTIQITSDKTVESLLEAGYETGWALADGALVLWQHDEDPPAPLTRPS